MRDITLRALDILAAADVVACEDTRVTATLFARYSLKPRLISYHEHNAEHVRPQIIGRLQNGETVALVSDAGSPLLSDPGFRLVAEAASLGLPVRPIPGASALTAALMAAGLATDRVLFAGFLPMRAGARHRAIAELGAMPATLVLFEAARRLPDTLAELAAALGERQAAVCREMTKLYEEIRRGTLGELAAHYAAAGAPRGEVTLVIARGDDGGVEAADLDDEAVDRLLLDALATQSTSEAARTVSRATGRPRQALYARAVALGRTRQQ